LKKYEDKLQWNEISKFEDFPFDLPIGLTGGSGTEGLFPPRKSAEHQT
jgi:hypothetical protein